MNKNAAPAALLAAALLLLQACAPSLRVGEGTQVAAINAPAEARVPGAAQAVVMEVSELPGCCSFEFTRPAPIRFQEVRRNLFGSQAPLGAASLAQNLGAETALLVGAGVLERQVDEAEDGDALVEVALSLTASLVDAATAEVLETVSSRVLRGSWTLEEGEELPEIEDDPALLALVEPAAEDLAPSLLALLEELAGTPAGD